MTLEEVRQLCDAYRITFGTPQGARVLDDLRVFCRYEQMCHFVGDPYTSAFQDGHRVVFLRILEFMKPMNEERMKVVAKATEE